ncbi:helix-turn-helix domain-containing protein [Halomonas sp. ISL-60]|uniref:helix-turn-helix domain-containing protein n=2 Tax=Halomonas TaxID=2745 RepID=UPI0007D92572|nr:helix-turn-helix domain-containing protein [Halomonas sp. ISL-104]MBT2773224.1 helix-turn-helix domain-containing protein [Halomonas sp. ISL-60]MBT2785385.1 helix-turn-helix domain-containing protein [Halomonas sp. ISL-106]MBT2799729.1 helix-turn-helix domain-containing protein [Halomonas sp. ISL-56]OAL59659.1 hypothetical protein A6R74_03220 [Halomonas sp. ALS9]MBT2799406.1 helix-turn-helix domain-containing protein [Halomonas sp. ISL-104]
MDINTKDEAGFLEDLNRLLNKHFREEPFADNKRDVKRYSKSQFSTVAKPKQGADLPTATASLMGLLSHLVDLENRVRVAESRGELRPLSSVGQVINEARTRQKLTVEALADLAGVGTVTIHKVEKGSLQVQVPKLVQIAEALGLELLVSAR